MGKDREHTWPVPFLQAFHQGELVHGKALGVKAVLKSRFFGNSNFTINLTTGPNVKNSNKDNVGLQLACKEKEGWILTSYIDGEWGDEEKYPLNVEEDEEFYVRIEPLEDKFAVFINGEKLCVYGYRLNLTYLNHVYIEGNVELHRVAWEGQYYMVPFEYQLDKFGKGTTLYITGKPERKAKKFDIDLIENDDNIVLTLSIRTKDQAIVRNSMRNGKWQDEERDGPGFPFVEDEDFDLIIDSKDTYYDIIINGDKFCKFYHREAPETVRKVVISGDLELKSVYM